MKAISLWQPWASLWCSPTKIHETRHWACSHRGPLLVHAAKRFEKDHPPELAMRLRQEFGSEWYKTLPTGAIVGQVDLTDCYPTEKIYPVPPHPETLSAGLLGDYVSGDFTPGRFAWRRNGFHLFKTPVPYRGMQGFFDVPNNLVPEARFGQ